MVTITVVRGRIFPDSASNRFAFVNAVGRAGTLMIFLARSAPRAESYAAWTLRSAGTADSKPWRMVMNQLPPAAKNSPLSSAHQVFGENPKPFVAYSATFFVAAPLRTVVSRIFSFCASPCGSSRTRCAGEVRSSDSRMPTDASLSG